VENSPTPKFVNPERYVVAVSVFEGNHLPLSADEASNFAGINVETQLEELTEYGILTKEK